MHFNLAICSVHVMVAVPSGLRVNGVYCTTLFDWKISHLSPQVQAKVLSLCGQHFDLLDVTHWSRPEYCARCRHASVRTIFCADCLGNNKSISDIWYCGLWCRLVLSPFDRFIPLLMCNLTLSPSSIKFVTTL